MKISAAIGLALASTCTLVSAQTERDLDSHEHGAAMMNVGIFDSNVFIELSSPWNNLVGFEHEPHTDEEKHAIEDAIRLLNDPDQLFSFNSGDCTLIETSVDSTLSGDDHDGDKHDDHDDDKHDDHDDDKHDDHDGDKHDDHDGDKHDDHDAHDHDDHDDEKDSHSEVEVSYNYQCDDLQKLKTINVELFSIWTGFSDIDVQMAGEKGQSFAELSPDNAILDVSQIR